MKHETPTRRPNSCRKFLPWISELAGREDLPEGAGFPRGARAAAERHLAACPSCREEARRDREVVAAFRRAMEIEGTGAEAGTLSPARRRSILDGAAERDGLGWGLIRYMSFRPAYAAAAAALLLVVLALPQRMPRTEPAAVANASLELEVRADGGTVSLRWNAPGESPRRVIRVTDPRQIASQQGEIVYGDSWVDPHQNGARVVYYAVE